jgi:hypothetical protein
MIVNLLRTSRVADNGTVLIWNESNDRLDSHVRQSWTSPPAEVLLQTKLDNAQDSMVVIAIMSRLLDMGVEPKRVGQFLRESESPYSFHDLLLQLERVFGTKVTPRIFEGWKSNQRANRDTRAWDDFYGSLVDSD